MGLRRNIRSLPDSKEVGTATLVDVLFLFGIEIQDTRISLFVADFTRRQAGSIVSPDFDMVPFQAEPHGRDPDRSSP